MTDNQTVQRSSAPWTLWAVGVLSLCWNGFGVMLWAGTTFMADKFLVGMPEGHREYVLSLPIWSSFTWGLGVLGGFVGAILLLVRSGLAVPAFVASLVGAVVNTAVYFTNPPPPAFFNPVLQAFIIGFALFQIWFANSMKQRGIL